MAASTPDFKGVYPILPTPFDEQDQLDLESWDRMIHFMADIGCHGVTILGVLGESNRLLDAERQALIRRAVQAAGDLPVIVGTSHTGTLATRDLSRQAEALGAKGVMVTPSREPVPSEARIFEFFQQVAEGLTIPIVAQDHPGSSQVNMSVELLQRLVNEIPQVACVKQEAPPTPVKMQALAAGLTRQVPQLAGLGALYAYFDLELGGAGFMTGFAFPEVLIAMTQAAHAAQMDAVWALYQRFLPVIVYEQQPGIAVRKEIFRLRGLLKSNRVRHPGLLPGG